MITRRIRDVDTAPYLDAIAAAQDGLLRDFDPETRTAIEAAQVAYVVEMDRIRAREAQIAEHIASRQAAWSQAWETVLRAASPQDL